MQADQFRSFARQIRRLYVDCQDGGEAYTQAAFIIREAMGAGLLSGPDHASLRATLAGNNDRELVANLIAYRLGRGSSLHWRRHHHRHVTTEIDQCWRRASNCAKDHLCVLGRLLDEEAEGVDRVQAEQKDHKPLWSIPMNLKQIAAALGLQDGRTVRNRYGDALLMLNRQAYQIDIRKVHAKYQDGFTPQ